MSFWSSLGGLLTGNAGSIISGLFGLGSNYTSAKMEYSQTKEGQARQYGYNTKLNKQQYKNQTKLNKQGYNFQTQLNKQGFNLQSKLNKQGYQYQTQLNATANQYAQGLMNLESQLTTAQNQWNALNLPSLNRQGYEAAGINPMLAINSSAPAQMIGATGVSGGQAPTGSASGGSASGGSASGSSVGGAVGARMDLLRGITDAFRTFQLDKDKNIAEIENLKANTENTNAKTITEGYNQKLIDAETQLRFIEKALKNKDLDWYDRLKLVESQSMMINALANETAANAASMNASTARQGLSIDRYKAITERKNYKLQKNINYKTLQGNKYWNSSKWDGHILHSIRNAFQNFHGR